MCAVPGWLFSRCLVVCTACGVDTNTSVHVALCRMCDGSVFSVFLQKVFRSSGTSLSLSRERVGCTDGQVADARRAGHVMKCASCSLSCNVHLIPPDVRFLANTVKARQQ